MTWRPTSRTVHLVAAIAIGGGFIATAYCFPDLRANKATTFGTISGFATFYGVVFAIIELLRTKAAALMAEKSSAKVLNRVEALQGMKHMAECQAAIEVAVAMVDRGEPISLAALMQIVKMYSLHFHIELRDPTSSQRENIAILESYALVSSNTRGRKTNLGNLKRTLISMTRHLSGATAATSKGVNINDS